jgi:hypothetical protein
VAAVEIAQDDLEVRAASRGLEDVGDDPCMPVAADRVACAKSWSVSQYWVWPSGKLMTTVLVEGGSFTCSAMASPGGNAVDDVIN